MQEDLGARFERLKKLQVGILVFPEVEVLDFAGGATGAVVRARHGLSVLPHASFDSAPALDLLIVPGGVVTQPLARATARRMEYAWEPLDVG